MRLKKALLMLLAFGLLGMAACADSNLQPQPEDASSHKANKSFVVIKDEQKEIEVTEPVVFDAENNALLSLPTHIGGNIELVVDGVPYVVCYGHSGDLVLEKDGRVYGLDGLKNIVETATGLSLDALCAYTVAKDEKAAELRRISRKEVFDMLAEVLDGAPISKVDISGEKLRFTNKLGANFDLYTEQSVIYSHYLGLYFDASAYQEN